VCVPSPMAVLGTTRLVRQREVGASLISKACSTAAKSFPAFSITSASRNFTTISTRSGFSVIWTSLESAHPSPKGRNVSMTLRHLRDKMSVAW